MATSRPKPPDYPLENFPLLNSDNSTRTSPLSEAYNCIAWAVEIDNKQYWPDDIPGIAPEPAVEWPHGIPNDETVEAFVAFFGLFGYKLCEGSEFEDGFVKVVIFVDRWDIPTHACRQIPGAKKWTSKMGWDGVDIEHDDLSSLEGRIPYGTAKVYLRKAMPN